MVQQTMVSDLTLYHDSATGLEYAGDIGETTPVSWQPRHDLALGEWLSIGNTLLQINASCNWWVGDWLNYGERKWGEMYAQLEATGYEYQTLANAKWVTGRVHFSLRREKLSWSHHKEVASLDPAEQAAWLNRAEAERWSVRRLREEIKGPQLPKLSLSFAEPTEAPFNHRPRVGIPEDERTAVDEYEQQADEYAETEQAYTWSADEEETVVYPQETEQFYTNGVSKPHVAHNSGNNEWYTPVDYIEAARLTLGAIDLDPASSDEANTVVRATNHYTIEDDGLIQNWCGRVWMNPPYSADLVGRFVAKLVRHYRAGDVPEAIVLVNNATETQWFQALAAHVSAICFPAKRIRFWTPTGESGSPLQGQAILYLGPNADTFIDNFSFFGLLARVAVVQEIEPDQADAE